MKLLSSITSCVLSAFFATTAARAQSLAEFHIGQFGEHLGWSLDRAGDVDGDGVVDTIVGSPMSGTARVYSGASAAVLRSWPAEYGFGRVVAGVGDLDADGFDDVAILGDYENGNEVHLKSGATGGSLRVLAPPNSAEMFGTAICGVGDIDGDGRPEIAIGAPRWKAQDPKSGYVYVYSFAKDEYLRMIAANAAFFGTSIANVGDVNGDGVHDMLVGAPSNGDSARLISGLSGLTLRVFTSPSSFSSFGASVAGLGPIGASGHSLVAVGAPTAAQQMGAVNVFDAVTGELVHSLVGPHDSNFGQRIASTSAADDATTFHSLIVGAPNGNGAVFVFDMPTGALLHQWTGATANAHFGSAVAGLGSRDGDKYGEIAVGAFNIGNGDGGVFIFEGIAPCGPITSYGAGCANVLGFAPKLEVTGCVRAHADSAIALTIEHGPLVPTTALLCIGAGAGHLTLPSGCALYFTQIVGSPIVLPLVPTPGGPLGPIPTAAITIGATVPAMGFGFDLQLQAIVIDPMTPSGFTTTNAVKASFLP